MSATPGPSLRRRYVYAFSGVLAQGGFRMLVNVLIGRFAGAAVLNHSAGLLAAAQLATLLGPTSYASAQTRYLARSAADPTAPSGQQSGVVRHVRGRVAVAAACVGLLVVAAVLLLDASGQDALLLLGVGWGLIAYGTAKSHMLALGRSARLAVSEVCTAAFGLAAVGGLLVCGVRDVSLLWPVAGAAWLAAGAMWLPNRSAPRLRAPLRREIDQFALSGIFGTLVSAGFLQASVLISSHYLGGVEGGQYAAAFALATPLSLVTVSVGMVLFPAFSRAIEPSAQRALLETSSTSMVALVVPPICVLMFLAPEVVDTVWGSDFGGTGAVLSLMLCAITVNAMGLAGSQALTATGVRGMRTSLLVGCVGASTGVLAWIALVPGQGAVAIAVGYMLGTLITSSVPLVIMGRRLGARYLGLLAIGWGAPLLAAVLASVMGALDTPTTQRVALGLTVAAAAAAGAWGLRKIVRRASVES